MTSVCRTTSARPSELLRAVIRNIGPRLVVSEPGITPVVSMAVVFSPRYSIQYCVATPRKVGPFRQPALPSSV